MSRENHLLQVALIVFVMLNLVLGVTTFLGFRRYYEATERARISLAEANRSQADAQARQEEVAELKRLLSYPAAATQESILRQFAEDMRTCAAGLPEEQHFYRPVLMYLHGVVRQRNQELAQSRAAIEEMKAHYAQRETLSDTRVQQHRQAAVRASEDLLGVENNSKKDRERLLTDRDGMHDRLVDMRAEADQAAVEAKKKYDDLAKEHRKTLDRIKELQRNLDYLLAGDYTLPNGTISEVSYRLRTARIDLGRADAVRPQVAFSVYPADAPRLNKSTKKGQIEVTRVLGDHTAEARVIDDKVTDPLIPGDKIHSPQFSESRR